MATLRSMTGFADIIFNVGRGLLSIDIQSVNRRFLEVQCNLPKSLTFLESEMRQWINENVGRGQVTINVFWKNESENIKVTPNLPLAKEIKKGWDLIAEELGLSNNFSLDLLAREKNIFLYEEKVDDINALRSSIKDVFLNLLKKYRLNKEEEGERLKKDIQERIDFLEKTINNIEVHSQDNVAVYSEKLRKKISELFSGDIEERVLKEAALMAERMDITEEIVRFKSHLFEFKKTLAAELLNANDTKGKKLDFLLQELNREINTLGNKGQNSDLTKLSVDIKVELEKIREQVQNIE